MAAPDEDKDKAPATAEPATSEGGVAATKPKAKPRKAPKKRPPETLPPYKVLLHNSDEPTFEFVANSIVELTPL